jgi:hypothetical protein
MQKFNHIVSLFFVILLSVGCERRERNQQTPTADPSKVETTGKTEPTSDIATSDLIQGEISLARNFYFIFDGSGSMRDPLSSDCGGDQSFHRKLEGAKWAFA